MKDTFGTEARSTTAALSGRVRCRTVPRAKAPGLFCCPPSGTGLSSLLSMKKFGWMWLHATPLPRCTARPFHGRRRLRSRATGLVQRGTLLDVLVETFRRGPNQVDRYTFRRLGVDRTIANSVNEQGVVISARSPRSPHLPGLRHPRIDHVGFWKAFQHFRAVASKPDRPEAGTRHD
jgi:hypothetical protein